MPETPKLLAGKIRQNIRRQMHWVERYPNDESTQPAAVLSYLLNSIDKGIYDWQPRQKVSSRLDRGAFRRYLIKGIAWCTEHPDYVTTIDQLQRLLDRIESGEFAPLTREKLQQRREARRSDETIDPSSVPQIDLNTSQNGAQSQPEAYAAYRSTIIDTEPVEQW